MRREIREFLQQIVQGGHGRSRDERLGRAVKDNYQRKGQKQTRLWPRKKQESSPNPPIQRIAKETEIKKAKRLGFVTLLIS